MKTKPSRIFTVLLVILLSFSTLETISVNGKEEDAFTGDIHGNTYINSDGSINPSTAPIQIDGEVYTITDDFHGTHLRIEKSNIIVDGNGYTLHQDIGLHHATNVTIKNFLITNPEEGSGIDLDHSPNNTITNNTIWGCGYISESMGPMGAAIFIHGGDLNLVYENNIINNLIGVMITGSPNTLLYNNNFLENQFDVGDFGGLGFGTVPSIALFDNGEKGNYWDQYSGKDNNNDGIGDTPYIINENIQDNYPLMIPISTIEPTPTPSADPTPVRFNYPATIILGTIVILVIVGILAYFKKYRRKS